MSIMAFMIASVRREAGSGRLVHLILLLLKTLHNHDELLISQIYCKLNEEYRDRVKKKLRSSPLKS